MQGADIAADETYEGYFYVLVNEDDDLKFQIGGKEIPLE